MVEHSIGKTIATLRKSKGWTQVELAERLNVSDNIFVNSDMLLQTKISKYCKKNALQLIRTNRST